MASPRSSAEEIQGELIRLQNQNEVDRFSLNLIKKQQQKYFFIFYYTFKFRPFF